MVMLIIVPVAQQPVAAQQSSADEGATWLENRFPFRVSSRRDNGPMMELVEPLCDAAGESTVQIFSGSRLIALGVVVGADGLIVTKRSELSGDPVRVRLPDKRLVTARVAAVRREADLALLECNAAGLTPARFSDAEPAVGSFLVTVGRGGRPLHLGVVSVSSRPLPAAGRLGVLLGEDPQGKALVDSIVPDSGAADAGLRPGDKILAVDGRPLAGRRQVTRLLQSMFPGEEVNLTLARDGDTLEVSAQIRDYELMLETESDARLNGPRNKRLSGFDLALQHDTVLDPEECGGPVVDSRGRIVGLNIARAGRVVSYALPAAIVEPEIESMVEEVRR
jgi:S1-C subfamily serine protease